jgi:hypothetical protein
MPDTSQEKFAKRWEPFAVPAVSLAVIATLGFLQDRWPEVFSTRPVALLSQLKPSATAKDSVKVIAALQDTVELLARIDTAKAQQDRIQKVLEDSAGIVPIEGSKVLQSVFTSLREGKGTRIAWFGDSFIEGDILVQDVREMLQKVFGGRGVGFVPVTSVTAQFRQSVHHTYSKDWDDYSLLSRRSPGNLGISGHLFLPSMTMDSTEASWVHLKAAARSGSTSFDRVKVLYSGNQDSGASIRCNGSSHLLSMAPGIHAAEFRTPAAKTATIRFHSQDTVGIHGISLEGDSSGILIDNFSFRGNSGIGLLKIPVWVLRQSDRLLGGYQLVVLQYGTNVTDASMAGFGWYGKKMVEVVHHLRQGFPNAAILMIGVGDRGSRNGTEIVSNPAVAKVVQAQRQAAQESQAAFWDLREAMGGENSMGTWARWGLASEDYTHISPGGGRRLGKAFAKAFLKAWETER